MLLDSCFFKDAINTGAIKKKKLFTQKNCRLEIAIEKKTAERFVKSSRELNKL